MSGVRIFLVCHASTAAVRAARFAADEPIDELGVRQARAARADLPRVDRVFRAPSLRCRQSAEALGVTTTVDARLAGCDYGDWAGRSFDEVAASDPAGVAEWLTDPACARHGGEPLTEVLARVGSWLDHPDDPRSRAVLAVADAVAIRSAVVHALGVDPQAIWRVDVDPLSTTLLVGEPGRWNLRALRPGRSASTD